MYIDAHVDVGMNPDIEVCRAVRVAFESKSTAGGERCSSSEGSCAECRRCIPQELTSCNSSRATEKEGDWQIEATASDSSMLAEPRTSRTTTTLEGLLIGASGQQRARSLATSTSV